MKKKERRLTLAFDRLLSRSLAKQLLILVGIMAVLFAVSYLALSLAGDDWQSYCDEKHISRWIFPLYLLIDANAFNDLYTAEGFEISKLTLFISGLTFVAGVMLFTGALISILTNVISQRVEKHNDGLIPYLKSGHYIIMGYDDMVSSIISRIFDRDPKAYVLLLSAVDAKTIHEKLRKTFTEKQSEHIIVNYGLRTSAEFYRDIHLEAAEEVYIVGLRSLPAHDAMNVENIDSICNYLKNTVKSGLKPKRITAVFEDLDTYASFKTTEIFQRVGELDIELVPYNFYTGWAHQLLLKQHYSEKDRPDVCFGYPSVYGGGIASDDSKFVHLVFVGVTNLSAAFAMEAAHILHFPNFNEHKDHPKTRITFIDSVVDKEIPEFITRNRHLFEIQSYLYKDLSADNLEAQRQHRVSDYLSEQFEDHDFLDSEFEFIKGDIFSPKVQHEISGWAQNGDRYLSIFLTMADQRKNFMMGMNMPDEVYDNAIPVFIRQNRSDNFVTNLREADNKEFSYCKVENGNLVSSQRKGRYSNIYPIGMNDIAFCFDETAVKRAKLINFLYNHADFDSVGMKFKDLTDPTPEQIMATASKDWKKLTVALKWSNLYCAYNIPGKLASLRAMRHLNPTDISHDSDALTEDEIAILAKVEHNRWNMEKLLMGYRKSRKEEDRYEHPEHRASLMNNKKFYVHHDIRPYEKLDDVKRNDSLIIKNLPWLLKMTE